MTYQDTLNWMFSKLPMYQRQGKTAYKADLHNSILLANHLKNPQDNIRTIHVAGTNGKGSTSHMLASVLQEAGYKVGLFTSPHLKDFRERIRVNGQVVSKQFVIGFIERNREFLNNHQLSFFEMTSGMAFDYFEHQKVDVAIIEVGLGGRLDSTNIILPILSIITNIGYDHTQFLGDTLEKIAFEKSGIIKKGIPVIIGKIQKETKQIFIEGAKQKDSAYYFADQQQATDFLSDLKGNYQQENIKTVVQTVTILNKKDFLISKEHLIQGLKKVVNNTGLQGRWQILQEQPKIICDTAHNSDGLRIVMAQLQDEPYKDLHIVFGVVNDKDLASIIDLMPKKATYYFCKPDVPRGLDAHILKDYFLNLNFKGFVYDSVNDALIAAKQNADLEDLIYVGGSTFVVAEII